MSPTNTRLDYLDAVRAIALILGIIFHASLSFMPIYIGWAVMDISTSNIVAIFALISHSFRMELFFLIAGFFSHLKFHQLGMKRFLKSRLVRILIPFIIGWFLLRPLLVSGWMIGAESMQGEADIWQAMINGFASLSDMPKDIFIGTHLWFLYYLLIILTSVALFSYLINLNKTVKQYLVTLSTKILFLLSHLPFGVFIVVIPTTCCLWLMKHWGVDTPDKSLLPNIPVLLIYGAFFLTGWLLHKHPIYMEKFAKLSWGKIMLGSVAIVACVFMSKFEANVNHSQYVLLKGVFLLSYAIMMWSIVSFTIGICKCFFKIQSNKVRYIADSSYWLYLIHLPLVVWLQTAFAELPLHWTIKLTSICVITLILSIGLYDAFVRSTIIGEILNGKRQTRVIFKRKK